MAPWTLVHGQRRRREDAGRRRNRRRGEALFAGVDAAAVLRTRITEELVMGR